MSRANLHPNALSGYSEDYPDPEDCADCGGTDCHLCARPDAPWHCGQCVGGWDCAECHRLFSKPGDPPLEPPTGN